MTAAVQVRTPWPVSLMLIISKRQLNYKPDAKDGTFWISYADYVNNYNNINLCRLYTDEIGKVWSKSVWTVCVPFVWSAILPLTRLKGEWKGRTAGGCQNHPQSYLNNPQWGLVAVKDTEVPLW